MVSANFPWHILDIFLHSFCRCFFKHTRLQPKLSMFCRHHAKFQKYPSSTLEFSFLYRYHCYHLSSIFEKKKDKVACPWVFFHNVLEKFAKLWAFFSHLNFWILFPDLSLSFWRVILCGLWVWMNTQRAINYSTYDRFAKSAALRSPSLMKWYLKGLNGLTVRWPYAPQCNHYTKRLYKWKITLSPTGAYIW